MIYVGVTGGLCAGKTTIAGFFREMGAFVIDADKIVHELYGKDEKIRKAILKNFGEEVFTREKISRAKLAKAVFGSKAKLKRLCSIVHPATIKKIKLAAKKSKKSVFVIDAPLLIEAGLDEFVDYVVVVKCSAAAQAARAAKKGFEKKDFLARKSFQMSLREKVKYADFVIGNTDGKKHAKKQVVKIWNIIAPHHSALCASGTEQGGKNE